MRHKAPQGREVGKGYKRLAAIRKMMEEQANNLSMTEKSLLRVLWYECAGPLYVSDSGQFYATCWNGSDDLADRVGCSRRTVYRAIGNLSDAGFLDAATTEDGTKLHVMPLVGVTECHNASDTVAQTSDTVSQMSDRVSQVSDTVSQPSDTVSLPLRKNRSYEQILEQILEQRGSDTLRRLIILLGEVYPAHAGMSSSAIRELAGMVPDVAAARATIERAGEHAAWLTANHPKGEDWPTDRMVKRLRSCLREGTFDQDPAIAHAHVKPAEKRLGGSSDRAMVYLDQIEQHMVDCGVDIDAPVQDPSGGRSMPRAGRQNNFRLDTRQRPETQQDASDVVSGDVVEYGPNGTTRRVM